MYSKLIPAVLVIITTLVIDFSDLSRICDSTQCDNAFGFILQSTFFLSLLFLLFLGLARFFLGSDISYWWKFARITVPVIFIISTIIGLGFHHTVGGFMNMSAALDLPALVAMYVFFSAGSLVQIYRGYRK
jgi:hypothetical protein